MKRKLLIFFIIIIFIIALLIRLSLSLSSFFLSSLGNHSSTQNNEISSNYKEAYKGSHTPDILSEKQIKKYTNQLLPSDDEYDYLYANDFQYNNLSKRHKARDSKAYPKLLGFTDATIEQIKEAIDLNTNIQDKYKKFIYQYACDLRTLYPNCNLACLYYNLKTLVIDEMSQSKINLETLSTDSAACYLRYENRICVKEGICLDRDSDDYIILVHELMHATRSVQSELRDYSIDISFYDHYQLGTYAEEGIVTNIAYQLQGLNQKAIFYPVLASYYRIIMQCIDYSGEDFFNHSVNTLIHKMDEFMNDGSEAYEIVARIDAQMALRYSPYQEQDYYDFQPVYDYLAKMYFKKYMHPDMTLAQAQEVFDAFYEDISFHFENLTHPYDIDQNTFQNAFDNYIKEIGITQ